MARIRTIKPEFQNSQSMGRVSRDARLTFIELWPQCDDDGRLRANSRMLASVLFPYDEDATKLIDGWLSELEKEGCIVRYTVGNDEYLAICHWDHQKIDHPKPSRLPPPPAKKRTKTKPTSRDDSRSDNEASPNDRAVSRTLPEGIKDQVSQPRASRSDSDFEEFWSSFPVKKAKGAAVKAFAKATGRAPPEEIIAGARRYALERAGQDKKFTAHPATWLNADRWLDEAASSTPPSTADPGLAEIQRLEELRRAEMSGNA